MHIRTCQNLDLVLDILGGRLRKDGMYFLFKEIKDKVCMVWYGMHGYDYITNFVHD